MQSMPSARDRLQANRRPADTVNCLYSDVAAIAATAQPHGANLFEHRLGLRHAV